MADLNLIFLALIQGITEFLPISSSGHLALFPALTGEVDQGLQIDVAVHVGTLFAVMAYFRRDVGRILAGALHILAGRMSADARLALMLAGATLPVIVAGLILKITGLHDWLRADPMRLMEVIAWTTVVFGLALWLADRRPARAGRSWTWRDAMLMGLAQAVALIPGVSRSGVTITAGRALGYDRIESARLAMLMSIPTILAAGALLTLDLVETGDAALGVRAAWAAGLAFVSALIALALMMRLLTRIGHTPFVLYRLALGAVLFWIVYT